MDTSITISRISPRTRIIAAILLAVLLMAAFGQLAPVLTVDAYASDLFDNYVSDTGELLNPDEGKNSTTTIITKYRTIAVALMGILTITMLIFMLIQFTKLGAAGDNEMARKKAIMGILTTGIATALLGGSSIVVGFFWNALTSSEE